MKKTRIVGRIIAGAVASALLLGGTLAAPAQADTGWNKTKSEPIRTQPVDFGS
ncbi:MAG TPA: hypothetical protein VFR87_04365 [Nocardioidaceae bacterium]|nr:hypothetical protein [Nocardioidaceae bacterium]